MVITERIESAKQHLVALARSERGRLLLRRTGLVWGGFFLSAAALGRTFQPIAMGLICAAPPGCDAVLLTLGAVVGYPVFWGMEGLLGSLWSGFALLTALSLGDRGISRRQWALLPSIGALIVAGTGLWFLLGLGLDTRVDRHLIRVAAGFLAPALFVRWRQQPGGWTDWAVQALGVLALAQVWPARYLGLGFVAAGYLANGGSFPALALAGLALDLSQVTQVTMTVVLCAGYCLKKIPGRNKFLQLFSAAAAYVPGTMLSGVWDVHPLPGLILGGALAAVAPELVRVRPEKSRGEAAVAQVRLEQMAMALHRVEQSLLTVEDPEPDRLAILSRCRSSACDTCPERRQCKGRLVSAMSPTLLEQPGLGEEDLPQGCRKPNRLLAELRRGQEQLRRMKADCQRLQVFRNAAREQYAFLGDFLQDLSDTLADRNDYIPPRFQPEIGLSSRSSSQTNGDCCIWFPGPGTDYYVLLCDGMGTGDDAARESMAAAELLKTMLTAGFPAEYALRSLNSLSILRNFGGCATVDLLMLRLDTGKGTLYKWGAAASYLMKAGQYRKIGTAGPPPGLSQSCRETVDRLSLGRGEVLILLSDGVCEEGLLNSARTTLSLSPGELAAAILEQEIPGGDDATAVVIRLATP